MPGENKTLRGGFSLLEIVFAFALILLILSIGMPRWRGGKIDRDLFVQQLNAVVQTARQQAIMTQQLHVVLFDIKNRRVRLEMATGENDNEGVPISKPIKHWNTTGTMEWPERFSIRNFFINKFDEMGRSAAHKRTEVFFYVVSDGLTQEVTINWYDRERGRKARQIGLVLNPFTGQFDARDTFAQ